MSKVLLGAETPLRRKRSRLALAFRSAILLGVVTYYLLARLYGSYEPSKGTPQSYGRRLLSVGLPYAPEDTSEGENLIKSLNEPNSSQPSHNGTHILAEEEQQNCTPPAIDEFPFDGFTREQRQHGWVVLHIMGALYCFWFLAAICDDYFVPAIEALCHSFKMNEDVVGATFMAAATSSPELFVNCVGTFVTGGDIGVGTIVGSAVFNILAVPACCGLLAKKSIALDWWPISRDCLMYCVAVLGLIITLYDGIVMWYEALILVLAYFIYISGMYYNDTMAREARKLISKFRRFRKRQYREVNEITPLLGGGGTMKCSSLQNVECGLNKCNFSLISISTDSTIIEEISENSPWNRGDARLFTFTLCWPITFLLWMTIPDSRKYPKLRFVTFFASIAWIGAISYIVAFLITIVGDTLNIPDSVLGLTILAAGMSIPEAVSSVIVTNQGHGGMGISNSIGSNTFDILLCLGLPWFIKAYFLPDTPGEHWIDLNSDGLSYSAVSLLTTLCILYISFSCNNFRLDWKMGVTCTIMYVTFLILASLIELNLFFDVNLPTCPH